MLLENIKRYCKNKGITVSELVIRAGITRRTLYEWDDHMPAADKLLKIAKCLDTTVEELLNDKATET